MQKKWETWVQSLGQENPLEEGIATYSTILAWRIQARWTEKPGGLWSIGSQRVGHNWSNLACTQCYVRRRQWHPTPVLLPGESHGQRSLVGCSPWVAKSRTRLSNFTFPFHFHVLEKEMATHWMATSPEYKEGMHQKATNQTSCFRCKVAFSCSFI